MKSVRLVLGALFAAVVFTSIGAAADGATASRSSAHFRITYQTDKASRAYAAFILAESERSWVAIFTTLGYRKPQWMSARIAAGGKVMLSLREMTYLGYASYRWNAAGVVTTGKIEFNYEAKFKDRAGNTNWHHLRGTCAHELFHLVQGAYDVKESKWLKETTAVWMESHAFPAEAKASPLNYGFRRFLGNWNGHRRRVGLRSVGDKQEYAASIFFHYLTEHDSRGKGLIKALWIKAGAVKGDTTDKAIAETLGDSNAWGAKTLKSVRGLSLTDLVRSSKRNRLFSLAALKNGPYITPTLMSPRGLTIPSDREGKLKQVGRTVASLSFDCINIAPDPRKVGSPVDVVLAARGKTDGAWDFHLVKAPRRGTWKVKRFKPPTGANWTSMRASGVDFRKEKLFFVATRASATSNSAYRLTGMVITPPVVESFEVHSPPAPGNAELGRTTAPPGGRELSWAVKRSQWRSPVGGTGWRSEVSPQTGIMYDPKNEAEIRIILNRKAPGGLTLKIGSDMSPTVTSVGSTGRAFRARVKIKDLEGFLNTGEIPVEIRGQDMFQMGLDGRPWTAPLIEFQGTDTPSLSDIKNWEGAEAPFVRPGGIDNLDARKIPLFRPKKPAPEIKLVKLSRKNPAELFYHSQNAAFRPITGGKVDLEISFGGPMDEQSADIQFRGRKINGQFNNALTWTGQIELPEGAGFRRVRGLHPISIQAKTVYGTAIDTDTDTADDQPDTTHKVVVDGIPPYIESVEVFGMGEKFYDAAWTGGPDLKKAENLSVSKIGDQGRTLKVRIAKDLPAEPKGTLNIAVRSSQPLASPPSIRLGTAAVTKLTSSDKMFWQGEVSMEAIRAGTKAGQSVPIAINATDIYGNRLDADPRTCPALATKTPWWKGYESLRGGQSVGYGGTDKWHEIRPAPRVSFVIVLDASGSMKDDNRMVNAKTAINKLLDSVPEGVELAIIIFQGTSNRAVGFTTDVETIRAAVNAASARDGTPLAAAIARARSFLESSSHPMSRDWRYRIFSDGQETAGGNVVLETRLLDQAIARRKGETTKKPKDKIPPPKPVVDDRIPIRPQRWTRHMVEVESRSGLDWIWLTEVKFTEKELPDGRCHVRFESKSFGVAYGSITDADGSNKKIKWRINSSPSPKRAKLVQATSDDGKAAIERIRRLAGTAKAKTKSMQQCRQAIQENVQREVN